MIDLLYSDILLEYKMLGESCHNFLRELDKEIVEQKRKKKLKLAKRLEIQFKNQWQPLKQAQVNDLGNAVKKQHLKNSKYKDDMNQSYLAWIERMKEQKYQDIDGLFTVTGITSRGPPRPLRTTSSKCKEIEAGANHIGILNNEGVLFMWGSNSIGRLGGTSDLNAAKRGQQRTLIAVDLPNEKKISTFSCGYSHTVAACDDGELYVWGSASVGKLGLGDISILHAFYCQTPVQLIMPHCRRIRVVSCGASHTACVGDSGELYVWGNGNGGRLGLGCDRLCDQIEPVLVESLAKECVVGVSCGNSQTLVVTKVFESVSMINNCAVTSVSGGNLFVAGPRGVLGSQCYSFEPYKYFMSDHQRIDQQPIEQISAGFSHQSAVSINGELFTWGDNTDGCCCHQTEKHFIKSPTLVKSLYKKGTDLAKDKSRHCSPPYGHQPFYEIDLGDTATIAEIKLWNTMKAPNNPAVNKATFNDRIFPSWIMVSQVAFPECAGEGGLQEALKVSVAKKRLTQNKHESLWHRK
jgi:alpha-tubulin suppressor-like RCC1 family protein